MKLVNLKTYEPAVGSTLDCDIYLKTSDVKVILLFKAQSVFGEEEIARCKKYTDLKCIYIKEEDYLLIMKKDSDDLKASLNSGGSIDHNAGFKITQSFFRSDELLSNDDKLDSMMSMANQFVIDLLKSSKDQRSLALVEMLNSLGKDDNVFVNHASEVAAISTMIALMTENITLENIIEINLVSILHGMGLMVMSNESNDSAFFASYADFTSFNQTVGKTDPLVIKKVMDKHFDGHNKLTTADNIIFLQHLASIEQNIDKIKIKNLKSQSVLKTMSDFKIILASTDDTPQVNNPFISAKVLAIGDRLVSLMNFYKKTPTFIFSAIRDLEKMNNSSKPIFDKKIMEKVSAMASP